VSEDSYAHTCDTVTRTYLRFRHRQVKLVNGITDLCVDQVDWTAVGPGFNESARLIAVILDKEEDRHTA
jgi:hypothetical protein